MACSVPKGKGAARGKRANCIVLGLRRCFSLFLAGFSALSAGVLRGPPRFRILWLSMSIKSLKRGGHGEKSAEHPEMAAEESWLLRMRTRGAPPDFLPFPY